MDPGPMKFTSDDSLPKENKKDMSGEKIIAGQLTGLKTHRNANYATRNLEPSPKCKSKARDNCINKLCIRATILAPASTSTIVFSLVATHPLDSCFCHSI